MPLYEYQCEKCGQVSEIMQKFTDPAVEQCPHCNGPVQKLISRTSFQLKGTGWYASDYKKSTSSSAAPISTPASTEAKTPAPAEPAASSSCGSGKCQIKH